MSTDLHDPAALAVDELHRLTALYGSGLLDDGPGAALDGLVALAASLLDCPALLTLVDRDTLRVHSSSTGSSFTAPREIALCDHAIRQPAGLVVPDLGADPRFAGNPFLTEDGIRFYAGIPVHAPDGTGTPRPIGALCVTDSVPRRLDPASEAALRHLAGLADVLIAARADAQRAVGIAVEHERLVGELARQHRVFAQAERLTGIGSWRLSLADERVEWSEGVFRIYGLPAGTAPSVQGALEPYPEAARGRVATALSTAIEHGTAFDFEEDFRPVGGDQRRVRCLGECEWLDGHKVALVGVFQDITERHLMEAALRHDADTDVLTGLLNRAAFDKVLAAAMARAHATQGPLRLVLIDLDGFKAVNDTLGHAAGDDVLRAAGAALTRLPFPAVAARIGGDEFALLIDGADPDPAALAAVLEAVLLFAVGAEGLTLSCSGSVGIAALGCERSPRDFFHRADQALYAAKRARVGERRAGERRHAA